MAQILSRCKEVLKIPIDRTYAWTDSTIVLSGLRGNPRPFKVFVGNRIAQIMELILLNAGDMSSVKTIQQNGHHVEFTPPRS